MVRRSRSGRKQLGTADGLVGCSLLARPLRKQYATVSVWRDKATQSPFATTEPHRQLMRELAPEMGTTKFVRWTISGADGHPSWRDALDESYVAENLVTAAAVELKVDYMSDTGDAIAQEVSALRETIEALAMRFDMSFTLRDDMNLDPGGLGQRLPNLRPVAKALFGAGRFVRTSYSSGIILVPNEAHANRCRDHLPAGAEGFMLLTGRAWELTMGVDGPAPAQS